MIQPAHDGPQLKRNVSVSVVAGDVTAFETDVLVLKYAQNLYGADQVVYTRLREKNVQVNLPGEFEFELVRTSRSLPAKSVLFVGVKPLAKFGYAEIRSFARSAISHLAEKAPGVCRVAFTVHGAGYGLDETEAFESELAGIIDALDQGEFPIDLLAISFVEINPGRVGRLSASLKKVLPGGYLALSANGPASGSTLENRARKTLQKAGSATTEKPHIFVAMPFAEAMDDVFHYGIQGAVNSAGFLCERADLSIFTGDVVSWVKQRISSASLVIADLSSANPNVYLEVGFAWGCQIPTVLLAKNSADLTFDVKSQRCILYKSISHLERALTQELIGLLTEDT